MSLQIRKDPNIKKCKLREIIQSAEWGEIPTKKENCDEKKVVKEIFENIEVIKKEKNIPISRRSQIMMKRHGGGNEVFVEPVVEKKEQPVVVEEKEVVLEVRKIEEPVEERMFVPMLKYREEDLMEESRMSEINLVDPKAEIKNLKGENVLDKTLKKELNQNVQKIERTARLVRDKLELEVESVNENMAFLTEMPKVKVVQSVQLPKINNRYAVEKEEKEVRENTHRKLKIMQMNKLSQSLKKSKSIVKEKNRDVYERIEESSGFYETMTKKMNLEVERLVFDEVDEEELMKVSFVE